MARTGAATDGTAGPVADQSAGQTGENHVLHIAT